MWASVSNANSNDTIEKELGLKLQDDLFEDMRVVLLQPVDSTIGGIPVLKIKPSEDTVSQVVYDLFEYSFMRTSVKLYYLVQAYLINEGQLELYEPAYLLLSQNQGGFPKFGFYLLQNGLVIDKTHVLM